MTYRKQIENMEWLCELFGIAIISTILFLTLPFLIFTFVNYYILDKGDFFVLPFPSKYVPQIIDKAKESRISFYFI